MTNDVQMYIGTVHIVDIQYTYMSFCGNKTSEQSGDLCSPLTQVHQFFVSDLPIGIGKYTYVRMLLQMRCLLFFSLCCVVCRLADSQRSPELMLDNIMYVPVQCMYTTSIASSTLVPSRISLCSWFVVVCEVYSRYGPKACDNEKRRWNQLGISLSTFKDFFITNILKKTYFCIYFINFLKLIFFIF